jgi:hypothetical protein
MTDDEFWQAIIAALLNLVDAIERWRGFEPRASECRKIGKSVLCEK